MTFAAGLVRRLPVKGDERGSLVALEAGGDVPFPIARVYTIFGTEPGVVRGLHAHRQLRQLAVAVRGACTMLLDDGMRREKLQMDDPALAVFLPPMIWHEMSNFTGDCVLMVLADAPYDEADYIRDRAEFAALAGAARS
jgi:dTDP-4-dehydrorhamnose 3,5-epimerase-like enzyme